MIVLTGESRSAPETNFTNFQTLRCSAKNVDCLLTDWQGLRSLMRCRESLELDIIYGNPNPTKSGNLDEISNKFLKVNVHRPVPFLGLGQSAVFWQQGAP